MPSRRRSSRSAEKPAPRKITYIGPPGTHYAYGVNKLLPGESVVIEFYAGHWVELVKSGQATCE